MKITQLARKPQLVKYTLDDPTLVEHYGSGESIEFWSWDRQPIDIFMQIAQATADNQSEVVRLVTSLILDESGNPVITDGAMLPTPVMMAAINQITERLGN